MDREELAFTRIQTQVKAGQDLESSSFPHNSGFRSSRGVHLLAHPSLINYSSPGHVFVNPAPYCSFLCHLFFYCVLAKRGSSGNKSDG